MYSYGNINISEYELHRFLTSLSPGINSTFDLLEIFRGFRARNEGISVGSSWNAHFGKILKMCEERTEGTIIIEIDKGRHLRVNGGDTMASTWQIL